MPTVDATTAGSRMLTSAHRTSPTANATPTSLQVIYQAFLLRSGVVANSLGINVVTAAASGGQAQMALHYLGANGAIGDQIPGAVTSAFAVTTTGMKSNSLGTPQFLLPGMYIAAFLFSGSGLVVTGYATTGNSLIGGSPFGFIGNSANPVEYRTETVSSFALPSTPGATATSGIGTAPAPMTFLGVL